MTPTEAAATQLLGRRRALGLLGGAGLVVALAACDRSSGTDAATAGTTATTTPATATTAAAAEATTSTTADTAADAGGATTVEVGGPIPTETAGPFPGDGTNGPNALTAPDVVRRDIRPSLSGQGGAIAEGIPLEIELTLADAATGAVLPGHAVYLWHASREGGYSLYGDVSGESYLRGVGVADAGGVVRFTSVFPAAYDGRWPHIHFEVFDDVANATTGRNAIRVSQLALPEATCDEVYATAGYESSVRNLEQTSLSRDMVFSDGVDLQLATMSGDPTSGYTAQLVVGI